MINYDIFLKWREEKNREHGAICSFPGLIGRLGADVNPQVIEKG
jgi:hypothetical protein